jgi:prevent-host-death family protein
MPDAGWVELPAFEDVADVERTEAELVVELGSEFPGVNIVAGKRERAAPWVACRVACGVPQSESNVRISSRRPRECANARMRECANARMRECANARMRECAIKCWHRNRRSDGFDRPSQFCYTMAVEPIPQRELRDDVSAVLRRVMADERLRVTVAGRDAADLVPVEGIPSWTSGARARDLIMNTQADPALAAEL